MKKLSKQLTFFDYAANQSAKTNIPPVWYLYNWKPTINELCQINSTLAFNIKYQCQSICYLDPCIIDEIIENESIICTVNSPDKSFWKNGMQFRVGYYDVIPLQ